VEDAVGFGAAIICCALASHSAQVSRILPNEIDGRDLPHLTQVAMVRQ
jgi:hypothetical protein